MSPSHSHRISATGPASHPPPAPPAPRLRVLVLSPDPVGAALIGALIETLGFTVRFRQPPESVTDALRRARPRVALIDCEDPDACTDETLGRAAMLGISVAVFGTRDQLDRLRAFALAHDIATILMPPHGGEMEQVLDRAARGRA